MLVGAQETVTEVIVGAAMKVPPPRTPQPVRMADKEAMTTSQTDKKQGFPELKVRTKVTIASLTF